MSIKDRIFRAKSKISIKTYKRPQVFIILMMILINIIILLVAAFIALLIDKTYTNYLDALTNGSLKWMLTPNAILLIDNPNTLFLAVIVLIIGMVLFTGTIIALTTNAIKDYFQKKKSGSGKLLLDQQIVILNWNNKVPELVADLIYLEKEDITIVILADVNKDLAEKLITNAIKSTHKDKSLINLNILVKQGNPLIKTDLYDISIAKAKAILIMNVDSKSNHQSFNTIDLNLIKTILNLGEIEFEYQPPIVAEIKNIKTKEKVLSMTKIVKSLHEHIIIPICFDRRLGLVIAQTIVNPLIKDVYLSMFSFKEAEVYFINNQNFNGYLKRFSHAIPLTKHKDGLYVLAEKETDIYIKSNDSLEYKTLKTKDYNYKTKQNIIIIGENNKLQFIKTSFDEYADLYQSHFNVNYIKDFDIENQKEDISKPSKNKTLLLLSDELKDSEHLDANIINNLIYLQSNIDHQANIIVEVLDPANDHIIKEFNINNTIISNKIISLLISKIVLYKETAPFYENLLTIKSDTTGKDDQNISIIDAHLMIDERFPIDFESKKQYLNSIYQSFNEQIIPLGYIRDKKINIFYGNLNQKEIIQMREKDKLIFMKL